MRVRLFRGGGGGWGVGGLQRATWAALREGTLHVAPPLPHKDTLASEGKVSAGLSGGGEGGIVMTQCNVYMPHTDPSSRFKGVWTHWDLNPGPSACEADVMPLHHVPVHVCNVANETSATCS